MKKPFLFLALAISFGIGFGFNSILTKNTSTMKRVTGIGGVFFKCKDPKAVNNWYRIHLGIEIGPYGATFEWKDAENPDKNGTTAWNTFPETTNYFAPSTKEFMVNYRVDNLDALVVELKKEGVTILDQMEAYD
jgi:catechol 2,3-dioxygenase-like lactoylglutathione lyase family enzyme